jgi:hypothetical protein
MKACTTREGDLGGETCQLDCTWSNCVATAKACVGNAGDACGLCNLGQRAATCNPSTGERACNESSSACTPGTRGSVCELPATGGQPIPGHQVCTQGCAFECEADPVIK